MPARGLSRQIHRRMTPAPNHLWPIRVMGFQTGLPVSLLLIRQIKLFQRGQTAAHKLSHRRWLAILTETPGDTDLQPPITATRQRTGPLRLARPHQFVSTKATAPDVAIVHLHTDKQLIDPVRRIPIPLHTLALISPQPLRFNGLALVLILALALVLVIAMPLAMITLLILVRLPLLIRLCTITIRASHVLTIRL